MPAARQYGHSVRCISATPPPSAVELMLQTVRPASSARPSSQAVSSGCQAPGARSSRMRENGRLAELDTR